MESHRTGPRPATGSDTRGDPTPRSPRRRGLTIFELLVILAVIGVVLGLVLPAVQSVRESARRLTCSHHLRQLGIALHAYHDVYESLPPGWQPEGTGQSAFGWATGLLAFVDQPAVDRALDRTRAIDAAENRAARRESLPVMRCPSDHLPEQFDLFAGPGHQSPATSPKVLVQLPGANYVGVFGTSDPDAVDGRTGNGPFLEGRPIRFVELQRGLSHTALIGERTAQRLTASWIGFVTAGEDAAGRVVGSLALGPNRPDSDECELSSRHVGCVNFLWADGTVRSIADGIDSQIYRGFAVRDQAGD